MKKLIYILILPITLFLVSCGGGDEFPLSSYTYIPDDNFEQALIDLGLDDVLDDYILTESIDTIESLRVNSKEISNLDGIEDFTALIELDCYNNQLTSLDLSNNTALIQLECWNNQLTSLNIINSINLRELLAFWNNNLYELDISKNILLWELDLTGNPLTSLDLSNNSNLEHLMMSGHNITSLDLSATNIQYFNVGNSLFLNELNLGNLNNIIGSYFYQAQWGNTPNLTCINVDYPANEWATTNLNYCLDPQHYFSEDCP